MPETRAACLASKARQNLSALIINLRMKVVGFLRSAPVLQALISLTGESSRIRAAGGFVEYGRVNGLLSVSLMRFGWSVPDPI